jgi:hypothetical protein
VDKQGWITFIDLRCFRRLGFLLKARASFVQRFKNTASERSALSWLNCCPAATAVDLQGAQQNRAERLIATARVLIAGFSLLAITVDPAAPVRHAQMASALVARLRGLCVIIGCAGVALECLPGLFAVHHPCF